MKFILRTVILFFFCVQAKSAELSYQLIARVIARGEGKEAVKCPSQVVYNESSKLVKTQEGISFMEFSAIDRCEEAYCLKGPVFGCRDHQFCIWNENSYRSISQSIQRLDIEFGTLPKSANTTTRCMYRRLSQ